MVPYEEGQERRAEGQPQRPRQFGSAGNWAGGGVSSFPKPITAPPSFHPLFFTAFFLILPFPFFFFFFPFAILFFHLLSQSLWDFYKLEKTKESRNYH